MTTALMSGSSRTIIAPDDRARSRRCACGTPAENTTMRRVEGDAAMAGTDNSRPKANTPRA